MSAVEVRGLRVDTASGRDIVDQVSFTIEAGELLGVVGESGSGKTTVGTALLGFGRRGARIAAGTIQIDGKDVLTLSPKDLQKLRGAGVAYVPQDPSASLNPALHIGDQLDETLLAHGVTDREERVSRIAGALTDVNLPADDEFRGRFAHQLSGGQLQRVGIAMAFLCRPTAIVLDEPTTGLDVTTQAAIVRMVRRLCHEHRTAGLYVTHDLAVLTQVVDRILVLYAGRVVEIGAKAALLDDARHPYTQRLFAAVPDIDRPQRLRTTPGNAPAPGERPHGCFFAPRCEHALEVCREQAPPTLTVADGHTVGCHRGAETGLASTTQAGVHVDTTVVTTKVLEVDGLCVTYGKSRVLDSVSFTAGAGECVALVGESGSGKTTLARAVAGLVGPCAGHIRHNGRELNRLARERPIEIRRRVQYIFQSPYNALNPRRTVAQSLEVPLIALSLASRGKRAEAVRESLARVGLSAGTAAMYPGQLSGGERQRVAIARALICKPELLICDEVTSALDVSVQAAIIELLRQLQDEGSISTMLFITHDLALTRSLAHRVVVLQYGRIVETGAAAELFTQPQHAYTRALLADTPSLTAS